MFTDVFGTDISANVETAFQNEIRNTGKIRLKPIYKGTIIMWTILVTKAGLY